MKITYSPVESQIFDYLQAVTLPLEIETDFTPAESLVLAEALEIRDQIREELSYLKPRIEACYALSQTGLSLAHLAYFLFKDRGEILISWTDFLEKLAALSEEDTRRLLAMLLTEILDMDKEEYALSEEVLTEIERSDLPPAKKWHLTQAVRYPLSMVADIVALLTEVATIYTPYFERYTKEREDFQKQFNLESLLEKTPQLGENIKEKLYRKGTDLIILSPWNIRFATMKMDVFTQLSTITVVSSRMDKVFDKHNTANLTDLVNVLKVIADETRYQVLVELTKPHAKNKDIAEKLGITTAAVSFHTQKLINSQFIVFNGDNKEQKYKINQALLAQLLDKLQKDFKK